jgi:hypothetical protein
MSQSKEFTEWELPIAGFQVYEVGFGGRIDFTAYGRRRENEVSAPSMRLSIGGKFHYVDSDGNRHTFDAQESWQSLTPLLDLRHRVVDSASADSRSHIEILFDDGSTLDTGPDGKYENWEVVGPDGLNLVGMPGGGDPRISGTDDLRVAGT